MEASLSICSDELREIFCEPCGKDRQTNLAEGFCADCSEYLCGLCYKYHKRFRQFEHHVLQDKNSMPFDPMHTVSDSAMSKDVCITKCRTHTDKVVEYICMSCDLVGCHDCITNDHELCESVRHIPIEVKKSKTSVEIQGFARKLDAMNENVKELQNKISKNFHVSDGMTKTALSDLGQQKEQLLTFFERLFEKIKSDLKEKQNTDNQVFTDCLKELTILHTDLQEKIARMSNLEKINQTCEIFIFMKDTQTLLKNMKSDMEKISRNGQETAVRYDRSIEIDDIKDEIADVGYLVFGESVKNKTKIDSKETRMEKVINSLNLENQDLKNDIGRMQAQVNDLCKQNTQLKTQVDKEKTVLNTEIQNLKQGYEARRREKDEALRQMERELRTKETQLKHEQEELRRIQEILRSKEELRKKDQKELNKVKEEIRNKQQKIDQLNKELNEEEEE
ncbi:golgin subfamily A member 6-like protein 7 [Ruditapes philippinarum]|uniref:golgin subfamily A member 6-like protein 7 n=1 Tax=Ruditapes philippinarum TaxID=129788 RepID=UPI00295BFB07|nr:golgin subfamily A member 6-like protein 7 [Ruditapes philippinarum]